MRTDRASSARPHPPVPVLTRSSCSRVTVLSLQVARNGRQARRRPSTTTPRITTTTAPRPSERTRRYRTRRRARSASKSTGTTDSPKTWARYHPGLSSAASATPSSRKATRWKPASKKCSDTTWTNTPIATLTRCT